MANKINYRRNNVRGDKYVRCPSSHGSTPGSGAYLKQEAARMYRVRADRALRREWVAEREDVVYPSTWRDILWRYW